MSWRTNCTFCHGTKTPVFAAGDISLSAPPDAIQQRLDGADVPIRTGQHSLHVNAGGFVPMQALACGACHLVPANEAHISADRRATVTIDAAEAFRGLTPAELARLPSPLGTYDAATNGCTSYCHDVPGAGGNNTCQSTCHAQSGSTVNHAW